MGLHCTLVLILTSGTEVLILIIGPEVLILIRGPEVVLLISVPDFLILSMVFLISSYRGPLLYARTSHMF